MSGGDRARTYQLFTEALDYEGALRDQFLTRECGTDAEVRAEVDALLRIASGDTAVTGGPLGLPGLALVDLIVGAIRDFLRA